MMAIKETLGHSAYRKIMVACKYSSELIWGGGDSTSQRYEVVLDLSDKYCRIL